MRCIAIRKVGHAEEAIEGQRGRKRGKHRQYCIHGQAPGHQGDVVAAEVVLDAHDDIPPTRRRNLRGLLCRASTVCAGFTQCAVPDVFGALSSAIPRSESTTIVIAPFLAPILDVIFANTAASDAGLVSSGLKKSVKGPPSLECCATTFRDNRVGTAITIPATPQNQPPSHKARNTMMGLSSSRRPTINGCTT